MTIEGEIVVRLAWDGRRVRDVAIRSTRPLSLGGVVRGRAVRDAAALVPRLFSVCAHAQHAAAAGALGAASNDASLVCDPRARFAVVTEALQEHLRRLLVDLPALEGFAPEVAAVAAIRKSIARAIASADEADTARCTTAIEAICADRVFGMPSAQWLRLPDVAALREWASREDMVSTRIVRLALAEPSLGASDVAPMPPVTRETIEANVLAPLGRDARYPISPRWNGDAVATGPWARSIAHPLVDACTRAFGNGVATLTVARLVEVAREAQRLRVDDEDGAIDAWSPSGSGGVAVVHTARGLLVHAARVEDGRVTRYAIVAPTEWNFQPDGPLARGLASLADDDERSLAGRARRLVHALDPCVACSVEVGHA